MIELTERAAGKVKEFIELRGKGAGIRLGVKSASCSGLSYKLEYADSFADGDKVFESNGVRVGVDVGSLPYLSGVKLDWVKEGLSEGFKFENPNVKERCGCGSSFKV